MRAPLLGLLLWLILASNALDQTVTHPVLLCGYTGSDSVRWYTARSDQHRLRQGCCMAPVLFDLYGSIFEERWTEHVKEVEGVGVGVPYKFDKKLFRRYTCRTCDVNANLLMMLHTLPHLESELRGPR